MGRGPKQTFFQRRHTDGQQAHEKMLNTNISNHQRNADQKPKTHHLTSIQMAIIKKTTNNKLWGGCGKKEPSFTVARDVNW